MDTFEVGVEFLDSTTLVTSDRLPKRWNWPRDLPLPRSGDEIALSATALGAQPMRVAVRRTEFVITPTPEALSNLYEAISAVADVQVRVRPHLAVGAAA